MNKYDIAGILNTYSKKILYSRSNKHIKEIIKELRKEIDLRKLEKEDKNER